MAEQTQTIHRDTTSNHFTTELESVARIESGDTVVFETHDPRYGALLDRPTAEPFELPKPDRTRGNPVTGPVYVEGAKPGDALLVEILSIDFEPVGWCGAHAHQSPVPLGRVPVAFGRTCKVTPEGIEYSKDLTIPLKPMIGCIGTGPLDPVSTQLAGKHGGNMDQPVVTVGAKVLLPVYVEGALLFVGDVHASQGDGELSGLGLETPAIVQVKVTLLPELAPEWPWVRHGEFVYILTAGETFEESAALSIDGGMKLFEEQKDFIAGDALALISLTCNIRVGASWGGPQLTTRLEIPEYLGVAPAGL
ncbi:MAG: acetamidase/formamidase family protein [Microbacteriaceae bacterium]